MMKRPQTAGVALLLVLVVLLGGYWGVSWWTSARFTESTNNAYVRADIVRVSAQVEGHISEVLAQDNERVEAGSILVRIQPDAFEARVNQGRADLARAEANVEGITRKLDLQQSLIREAEADLDAAIAGHALAAGELERARGLIAENVASAQHFDRAIAEEKRTSARVAGARAHLLAVQQELDVLAIERQALQAEADLKAAAVRLLEIDVGYTNVRAPISGIVGNRTARTGQFVRPGMHLLAVVPVTDVWIEANFKETQLTRMAPGQPVTITIDTYPGITVNGRIQSMSPASGAEFSLLPPENATGNFSKVVQRIPIRIALPKDHDLAGKLRPGMSAVVSVNTRDDANARDSSGAFASDTE